MKRELQKLIQATALAVRAWSAASENAGRLPADGLRPSFIAHRLACALSEMEELLAVHSSLWPQDQAWRKPHDEAVVGRVSSKAELARNGAVVAEEERPEPALAQSQNIEDLFEFFCQVRKSILYASVSTDAPRWSSGAIDAAMESIQGLDRSKRAALYGALTGYISNSFIYSNARLPGGSALGERYSPLFGAVRRLRGETNMNIDEINGILDEAKIKHQTRELVGRLINALRRMLAEYDIDRIRDILASGGELFPELTKDGSIVVIPGDSPGHCGPIVLAIAKGRDGRARHGVPNVMREVRAHLIHCFDIAEVVILLTDRWDPDLMKESEADFAAYASRTLARKVLIPIVTNKRQLMPYDWP